MRIAFIFLALVFFPICAGTQGLTLSSPTYAACFLKVVAMGGGSSFPAGAAHNWTVNEASGTRVDGPGDWDLLPAGSITVVGGKNGNAIDFGVDGSLEVDGISLTAPFTIVVWINFDSQGVYDIFCDAGGSFMRLYYDSDRLKFHVTDSESPDVELVLEEATQWHLVVAKFVGSTASISVDAGNFVSGTMTGGLEGGDTIRVGAGGWTGLPFDGQVDAITIFTSGLSDSDVDAIYDNGNGTFYAP